MALRLFTAFAFVVGACVLAGCVTPPMTSARDVASGPEHTRSESSSEPSPRPSSETPPAAVGTCLINADRLIKSLEEPIVECDPDGLRLEIVGSTADSVDTAFVNRSDEPQLVGGGYSLWKFRSDGLKEVEPPLGPAPADLQRLEPGDSSRVQRIGPTVPSIDGTQQVLSSGFYLVSLVAEGETYGLVIHIQA